MDERMEGPALLVESREAAKMLAVSPRKLWAMTFEEEPAVPHIKLGRLVRYSVKDLQRWIECRTAEGGEQ